MRRSLILVTAGVTSMVVIAFLVPLGILVSALAFDRAVTGAERDAENVARLVAVVGPSMSDDAVVAAIGEPALVERGASLIFPGGEVAGLPVSDDEDLDAALAGAAFRAAVPAGEAVYVPVAQTDGTITVVRVVAPSEELTSGVRRSWLILAGLGVVLVGLAVLAADRFGRSIVRPVNELSVAAARLKQGDFTARVTAAGPPEIEEVGAEFNLLAEQVEHLLQEERETAADLAHRLRTPLTAAKLDAEALSPGRARDRIVDDLDELERTANFIIAEGRRPVRTEVDPGCDLVEVVEERAAYWLALSEEQDRSFTVTVDVEDGVVAVPRADAVVMIDAVLENVFAHTDDLDELERTANFIIAEGRRPVRTEVDPGCDLVEVVEERAAYWLALSEEQDRSFTVTVDVEDGVVAVPRADAVVMIDAVLENVFAHTDERTPLAIGLTGSPGEPLRLEVEDGGAGIAHPDAVDRGASTGDSSGLGLDIVRRTAEASGGSLEVGASSSLGGARVLVRLPRR